MTDERWLQTSLDSFLVLPVVLLLPLVAVVASYSVNRDLLMVLFLFVGCTVLAAPLASRVVHKDRFFIALLVSVSLSLLMSTTLSSENLVGYDVHGEFSAFSYVLRSGFWDEGAPIPYNSVLSVTILPSALSMVLGIDGLRVFKFVFPLLFCLIPIVLYKFCRKVLAPEAAFISAFFFASSPTFYAGLLSSTRQGIAEFLLSSLFLVFMSTKLSKQRSGRFVVVLLTIGLATAHYSLGYIYVVLLGLSYVMSRILRRTVSLGTIVTLSMTFAITLSWYSFVTRESQLWDLTRFMSKIAEAMWQDFLNPASRPTEALQALGIASVIPGFWHDLNRLTHYAVASSMILGFFTIFLRKEKSAAEREMVPLITFGMILLGSALVIPYFAEGLNLNRLYHIALLMISPSLLYGTETLVSAIRRIGSVLLHLSVHTLRSPRTSWFLAAIMVFSYFLFTSGWVWAVTNDIPTSVFLDSERLLNNPDPSIQVSVLRTYTSFQNIAGVRWLRAYLATGRPVCADYASKTQLLNSYGDYAYSHQPMLPYACNFQKEYIFLSVMNTCYGVGFWWDDMWLTSDISRELAPLNRICSNGGATVYVSSTVGEA